MKYHSKRKSSRRSYGKRRSRRRSSSSTYTVPRGGIRL